MACFGRLVHCSRFYMTQDRNNFVKHLPRIALLKRFGNRLLTFSNTLFSKHDTEICCFSPYYHLLNWNEVSVIPLLIPTLSYC